MTTSQARTRNERSASRRQLLGWAAAGGAALASATLAGGRAVAQETDEPVGSWLVDIRHDDGEETVEAVTFTSGGGFVNTGAPLALAPPEAGTRFFWFSGAHGVWERTGPSTVGITFAGVVYDDDGKAIAMFRASARWETEPGHDTASGRFRGAITALSGDTIAPVSAIFRARRVRLEPICARGGRPTPCEGGRR